VPRIFAVEKAGEERGVERATENDSDRDRSDLDRAWGDAPPYGAYRGRYGDYDLSQTGSMGSGRLGGWSAVGLGGFFDDATPATSAHLPDHHAETLPDKDG
jgi:hypothetical protein